MFDISVITAVKLEESTQHSALAYLQEAIESVGAQKGITVEHVIVSNGSDYPLSVVRDQVKVGETETQWLSLPHPNASEARNFGVRASRGQWIIVLDGDDRFASPDVLANLYRWRCQDTYVYGHMVKFDDEHGILNAGKSYSSGYDPMALREMSGTVGVTALHHRDAWAKIGGWSGWLDGLEDIEYWIKAAERGICGLWVDTPMLLYRQRTGSRTERIYRTREINYLRERIREKHKQFMGGKNVACAKCPPSVNGGEQNFNTLEGMIAVKYAGARIGAFNITTPNRRKYRVEGKGTWLNVHPEDMPWLMAHNTGSTPDYIPQQTPQAMPVAEVEAFEPVPFEPVEILTNIKTLNAREAKAAVNTETRIATLSIWLAQENSSESPRKSVISDLERRISEIGY